MSLQLELRTGVVDLGAADGVVSVPTRWALDQGFASSLENPDRPGHSVYQVDMYHSLHCLVSSTSRVGSIGSLLLALPTSSSFVYGKHMNALFRAESRHSLNIRDLSCSNLLTSTTYAFASCRTFRYPDGRAMTSTHYIASTTSVNKSCAMRTSHWAAQWMCCTMT